jgi:hypothetical protein
MFRLHRGRRCARSPVDGSPNTGDRGEVRFLPCGGAAEIELAGELSWQQVDRLPSRGPPVARGRGPGHARPGYGPITLPVELPPVVF